MHALSEEDRFNLEVVKLLLEVARVDNDVDKRERDVIMGLARSWSVPEPELKQLLVQLDAGLPTPPPDYAVLKQRPDDVLSAARAVVLTDNKVAPEETALLKKVKAALES